MLEPIPPLEACRRWLRVVGWRLEQSSAAPSEEPAAEAAYASADELARDVRRVYDALVESGDEEVARTEVQAWLDQIDTFGLHMARLDVRQHSEMYADVMVELWQAIGLVRAGEDLTEERRCQLLVETLPIAANIAPVGLSETAQETLQLFRVLRRSARRFGGACLGGHVVSMTKNASDLLTVLWLWTWSERVDGGVPEDASLHLPVIPAVRDHRRPCRRAGDLGTALSTEPYRQHVAKCGDRQIVMIGYSDSTKDGGYLSAAWSLPVGADHAARARQATRREPDLLPWPWWSLGRGGGPAARSIRSLPPETFDGSLRLTEQGEVLAERYDDPAIAHRHLEQVFLGRVDRRDHAAPQPTSDYRERMQRMADASLVAYRELVTHPKFTTSSGWQRRSGRSRTSRSGPRPSKRKKGDSIEDLRAIPWVFSWTQSRCLLPAWYGLGAGLEAMLANDADRAVLREMYADWPFLPSDHQQRGVGPGQIEPSGLRPLCRNGRRRSPTCAGSRRWLDSEYDRARDALLQVVQREELLGGTPWLQESIRVRNRYVDPLNLIQLEVMRRVRESDAHGGPSEELKHLSQLSVKSVAAGMRTTG